MTPEKQNKKRIADIDMKLADLDREYLTPRVLGGIGIGDEYAIGERKKTRTGSRAIKGTAG